VVIIGNEKNICLPHVTGNFSRASLRLDESPLSQLHETTPRHILWSFDDSMAGTYEGTTRHLREHLRLAGLHDDSQAWTWVLARSPLGGRGVIATRDIAAGELVSYDVPLVLGPRAGLRCPPLCVGCHQGSETLVSCSSRCGLPVCSTLCEDGSHHVFECQRLRSWGVRTDGSWSEELLRTVIPVRCLSLSPVKRQVLQCLQSHCGPEHAFQVWESDTTGCPFYRATQHGRFIA
jgi:hypothetical protein